jgi:DNA-binding CsgD family transcriptional regulator
MSNKEVARQLNIAEGTSKIHTAALLRALARETGCIKKMSGSDLETGA